MTTTVATRLISLADKATLEDRMEEVLALVRLSTCVAKTEAALIEAWINEVEKAKGITTVYSTLEIIEQALIELGAQEHFRNSKSGGGPTQ